MDHRISQTIALYFGDDNQNPDEAGLSFELADVPEAWGPLQPRSVRQVGLDLHVAVDTATGPHTLILGNDTQVVADSFQNFDTVVIIGVDAQGEFALEAVVPWAEEA